MKSHSELTEEQIALIRKERIQVCVRKRPFTNRDSGNDILSCENSDIKVCEPKVRIDLTKYEQLHTFSFDAAFDDTKSNSSIYATSIQPRIDLFFQGYTCTCFAYGQTGSGKTYTMLGASKPPTPGLVQLAVSEVCDRLATSDTIAGVPRKDVALYVSFFEIYTDKLFDLLNERKLLHARENHRGCVVVQGLKELAVESTAEVFALMHKGLDGRTTGVTGLNSGSSRSHAIFQLCLKRISRTEDTGSEFVAARFEAANIAGYKSIQGEGHGHVLSKLSFVDLAGSERLCEKAKNSDKQTRLDGAAINRSLLALKECIRALDMGNTHQPFRGSKLTMVLKDSFVGNHCLTLMIANVSPCSESVEHTLNTLRYGDRVKELHKGGKNRNLDFENRRMIAPQRKVEEGELTRRVRSNTQQVSSPGDQPAECIRNVESARHLSLSKNISQMKISPKGLSREKTSGLKHSPSHINVIPSGVIHGRKQKSTEPKVSERSMVNNTESPENSLSPRSKERYDVVCLAMQKHNNHKYNENNKGLQKCHSSRPQISVKHENRYKEPNSRDSSFGTGRVFNPGHVAYEDNNLNCSIPKRPKTPIDSGYTPRVNDDSPSFNEERYSKVDKKTREYQQPIDPNNNSDGSLDQTRQNTSHASKIYNSHSQWDSESSSEYTDSEYSDCDTESLSSTADQYVKKTDVPLSNRSSSKSEKLPYNKEIEKTDKLSYKPSLDRLIFNSNIAQDYPPKSRRNSDYESKLAMNCGINTNPFKLELEKKEEQREISLAYKKSSPKVHQNTCPENNFVQSSSNDEDIYMEKHDNYPIVSRSNTSRSSQRRKPATIYHEFDQNLEHSNRDDKIIHKGTRSSGGTTASESYRTALNEYSASYGTYENRLSRSVTDSIIESNTLSPCKDLDVLFDKYDSVTSFSSLNQRLERLDTLQIELKSHSLDNQYDKLKLNFSEKIQAYNVMYQKLLAIKIESTQQEASLFKHSITNFIDLEERVATMTKLAYEQDRNAVISKQIITAMESLVKTEKS